MKPQVKQVLGPIYRVETPWAEGRYVFLYLLKGDRIALIDTGSELTPREYLQPALAEVGLTLSDVDLILNTHVHLDHSGGNLDLKRISRASICLHSGDRFMAESTEAQVEFMTAPLRALGFPAEMVRQRAEHVKHNAGETAGVDVLLSEGDIVDLGGNLRLRVVHCPGHTPGSVSYYWESGGVLLTGDSVQGQGPRPGTFPLYFNASDYRRSLTNMMALEFRVLCLAHPYIGGSLVNDPTRTGDEGRALLRESVQVADSIHRAVEKAMERNPSSTAREFALDALSELLYEVPQLLIRGSRMPFYGGPTIMAHIDAVRNRSYPM